MFKSLRSIRYFLPHIPGWRTSRKIIVIESDDWGSIRMPSSKTYRELLDRGYHVDRDPFMKYDSLASEQDLSNMFEVFSSVRDKNDNPAILTANCVVTNPDFDKINASDFETYHYELFTETLNRYSRHQGSFDLWKEGMEHRLFHPQYHGREHVNIFRWMEALKNGDEMVRQAFDLNMISFRSEPVEKTVTYMESMEFRSNEQKEEIKFSLAEGVQIFSDVFGWSPDSFIGTCYIWSMDHEAILGEKGIKYIQGIPIQRQPVIKNGSFRHKHTFHYTGQKNRSNQFYLVRNAYFEPSINPKKYDVDGCLNRINIAFKWRKPVIISAHRLNFIGFVDEVNRDRNLKDFRRLLKLMLLKWPDIEFMTSDQLGRIISNEHGI